MTGGTGSAAALDFLLDFDLATVFEALAGTSAGGSGMGSGMTTGSVAIGGMDTGIGDSTMGSTFLELETVALSVAAAVKQNFPSPSTQMKGPSSSCWILSGALD